MKKQSALAAAAIMAAGLGMSVPQGGSMPKKRNPSTDKPVYSRDKQKAIAKRRAKNKVARKSRAINRHP